MNFAKLIFGLLLGRRLPVTSGRLSVEGLRRPVRIDRDAWGIPSITAENDADAWFALGFCQGQDRAFQLEGMLRVVRGTPAELVTEGDPALASPVVGRTAYRIVREAEFVAPAEFKAYYERLARGYARGVRVAQLAGEIDAHYDPEVLAYVYAGLGNFVGMRWAEWTAGGRVPDDVLEDLIQVLARGLPPRDLPPAPPVSSGL